MLRDVALVYHRGVSEPIDISDMVDVDFGGFGDLTEVGDDPLSSFVRGLPAGEITFSARYVTDPLALQSPFSLNGRKVGRVVAHEVVGNKIEAKVRVENPRALRAALRPQAWRRSLTMSRDPHHRSRGMRRHIRREKAKAWATQ